MFKFKEIIFLYLHLQNKSENEKHEKNFVTNNIIGGNPSLCRWVQSIATRSEAVGYGAHECPYGRCECSFFNPAGMSFIPSKLSVVAGGFGVASKVSYQNLDTGRLILRKILWERLFMQL